MSEARGAETPTPRLLAEKVINETATHGDVHGGLRDLAVSFEAMREALNATLKYMLDDKSSDVSGERALSLIRAALRLAGEPTTESTEDR